MGVLLRIPGQNMIYYLDESGNTGDLARSRGALDFGQSVFVLACIGVEPDVDLKKEIQRLRDKYRLQGAELKSTAMREKPQFVTDLAEHLGATGCPMFVEVVEKRFLLCANMIDRLIMPPVGRFDLEAPAIWFRNILAEYLHANLPASIMRAYVGVCTERSSDTASRVYDQLLAWLEGLGSHDQEAEAIRRFSIETRRDFEARAAEEPDAWVSILPIPDESKKGRLFWMLPNLSSLMNIYARINLYHARAIEGLTLIHDEQMQYDEILRKGKKAEEALTDFSTASPFLHADYGFAQQANLEFGRSVDYVGVQIADVVAGFVMRYAQDKLFSQTSISRARLDAFQSVVALSEPTRGTGVNFVLSSRDVGRLGVRPISGLRAGD
jgi:hypothetical protein